MNGQQLGQALVRRSAEKEYERAADAGRTARGVQFKVLRHGGTALTAAIWLQQMQRPAEFMGSEWHDPPLSLS